MNRKVNLQICIGRILSPDSLITLTGSRSWHISGKGRIIWTMATVSNEGWDRGSHWRSPVEISLIMHCEYFSTDERGIEIYNKSFCFGFQYRLWQTLHIVSMNISVHVKTNTKAFPFGPTVLSSRGASYSVGLLDNLWKIIFDMRWNCGRRAWISTSHCPLWYAVAGPGDLSPLEPFELDPALPIPSFGESQLMYPPMAHGAGYV